MRAIAVADSEKAREGRAIAAIHRIFSPSTVRTPLAKAALHSVMQRIAAWKVVLVGIRRALAQIVVGELLRQAVADQPAFAPVLERAAAPCASAVLPDSEPSKPWVEQPVNGPLLLQNVVDVRGWRVADALAANYTVPVQLSPVRHMPVKHHDEDGAWHAVRPAERVLPLQRVLQLLRQRERGYSMYVRSLPLWAAPELAESMALRPRLDRALALAGPRLAEALHSIS